MSGMFDFFKKMAGGTPAATKAPEEFSGYEEEGSRPTEVKTPSEMDNFRFGMQGGNKGNAPGSWGEAGGRFLRSLAAQKYKPSQDQGGPNRTSGTPSPKGDMGGAAFANIKRLLGY